MNEPIKERFLSHVSPEPMTGCWLWTGGLGHFGYATFSWACRSTLGHRASWKLFKGDIPAGLCVLHKCDVPACVNPEHLFLGTKGDNSKDRDQKLRHWVQSGQRHYKTTLTGEQVQQMRILRKHGHRVKDIAAVFSCTEKNTSRICNGTRWKVVN